jgi:hypothetical protein
MYLDKNNKGCKKYGISAFHDWSITPQRLGADLIMALVNGSQHSFMELKHAQEWTMIYTCQKWRGK